MYSLYTQTGQHEACKRECCPVWVLLSYLPSVLEFPGLSRMDQLCPGVPERLRIVPVNNHIAGVGSQNKGRVCWVVLGAVMERDPATKKMKRASKWQPEWKQYKMSESSKGLTFVHCDVCGTDCNNYFFTLSCILCNFLQFSFGCPAF